MSWSLALVGRQAAGKAIAQMGMAMYVGFAAGWIGLWTVFGHPDPRLIATAAAVAVGVHLFVVFYEEPTLRKKFGTDYLNYCSNVRRWWPRVQAWNKPQ